MVHHLGFGFRADDCAPGILRLLEPVRERAGLVYLRRQTRVPKARAQDDRADLDAFGDGGDRAHDRPRFVLSLELAGVVPVVEVVVHPHRVEPALLGAERERANVGPSGHPVDALALGSGQDDADLHAEVIARRIASTERSTSSWVVVQLDTEIRIRRSPCQVVPPIQHVPSCWTAAITRSVRSSSPNPTRTWFSTTSFAIVTSSTWASCSANRR